MGGTSHVAVWKRHAFANGSNPFCKSHLLSQNVALKLQICFGSELRFGKWRSSIKIVLKQIWFVCDIQFGNLHLS